MDKRDEKTWITLELTTLGEIKVDEGCLEKILKRELSEGAEIFIPVSRYVQNGRKVTLHLLEGYIFISSGLDDMEYFDLEHTPYIETVFSTVNPKGMRVLSTISNSYVEDMKDQLRGMSCKGLSSGDEINIVKGAYRKLTGKIVGFEEDVAFVSINLRSLSAIVELPNAYLSAVGEEYEND
jgi:transcription antitermination factor NusG